MDYSQWSKSRGCMKKTPRFNASNPPGPAAAKASDHLRCHLLCTGRFHTRWDDEGFIPHSHWRSRCLGDQLALHPPCSTLLQLQDSNIYIYISACQNVYRLPILVYYFPGLFQMYLYVVLRSILRVFGYLWIFRFITWKNPGTKTYDANCGDATDGAASTPSAATVAATDSGSAGSFWF